MKEGLKIYCNHGIYLFHCQQCIDALVAEEIANDKAIIENLKSQLIDAQAKAFEAAANDVDAMITPKAAQFFRMGVVNHFLRRAEFLRKKKSAGQKC